MDTTQKIRISFSLPLELKERFAEVCAKHDMSASQKIRQLMNQVVREDNEKKSAH